MKNATDSHRSDWKIRREEWTEAKPWDLEPYRIWWVEQLTAQGLHAKADIADVLGILSKRLDAALSETEPTEEMLTAGRDAMVAYLFGECPGDTPLYDAQIGAVKRAYKAIRALKNSPQGDQNADPQEAESALPVKADREEGPRPAKHAAPVGSAPCVVVPRYELEGAHQRWNGHINERAMLDALKNWDECVIRWLNTGNPERPGE